MPEAFYRVNGSMLSAQNSELLGAMSAKHQDAFDVARSARACDQSHEARIVLSVFFLQECERIGQVADELRAAS